MFVSQVSADRMNEIYDTPTAEGAEKFEPKGYDIVFEHVGFSYDEKEVLHDVSFTAKEGGKSQRWLGSSGSGKRYLRPACCKAVGHFQRSDPRRRCGYFYRRPRGTAAGLFYGVSGCGAVR